MQYSDGNTPKNVLHVCCQLKILIDSFRALNDSVPVVFFEYLFIGAHVFLGGSSFMMDMVFYSFEFYETLFYT